MSTIRCRSNEQPPFLSPLLGNGERRLFYGWVMLPIAMLGVIATSPAQTYGVSVFNDSFRQALGLSHSQLTGAYMLGTLLASLPMSYVGALMDRHGLRRTMTVVVVLLGMACVLASQVTGLFTLFLAFLLLRMLGQGALNLLSSTTLAFWFDRRLGLVDGIRRLGVAGAIAAVPAVNLWLIDAVGWRWAYAVLGLAVWAVMLPLMVLFFRNRPEDVGQRKDGLPAAASGDGAADVEVRDEVCFTLPQTLRTRSFWIMASALALWGMVNTAVLFNILPLFASRGLTEADAAMLFTTFAGSLAVMHIVGGLLADRLPLNLLLAIAVTGLAGSVGVMRILSTPTMVVICGILMGVAQGLITATASPLWPRYYGRTHLGKIRGLIATTSVASTSIGPFLMGGTYDLFGSYDPILTVFMLLPIPLIPLALFATPPVRRAVTEGEPVAGSPV